MKIEDILISKFHHDRKYYLVTPQQWSEYEDYLRTKHPLTYKSYQQIGYDKISRSSVKYKRRSKSGIPCMEFRGIPVVELKYWQQMVKIYA